MKQKGVTFYSDGDVIVADLYMPDSFDASKPCPAIVQCQGFTGIRDMVQPEFAKFLTAAGFVSLAIDYRGWGDSGGARGRLAPLEQVEDVRNALSYLEMLPFIDSDRLGVFGASFGALIAPYTAAIDERVKANAGMVGVAHGLEAITNRRTPEEMEKWKHKVAQARRRAVTSNEIDRSLCVLDIFVDDQSMAWEPAMWEAVPKWQNHFGFDSIGRVIDFRPIDIVHRIAPRASLMIVATRDTTGSPTSYRELFAATPEPKRLFEVPCGHYDIYSGQFLIDAMAETVEFFQEYL